VGAQDHNPSGSGVAEGVEPDYYRTGAPYEVGGAVQFRAGPCFDGEGKFEAASKQSTDEVVQILKRMMVRLRSKLGSWLRYVEDDCSGRHTLFERETLIA